MKSYLEIQIGEMRQFGIKFGATLLFDTAGLGREVPLAGLPSFHASNDGPRLKKRNTVGNDKQPLTKKKMSAMIPASNNSNFIFSSLTTIIIQLI
jgi:hypothetical protein